MFRFTAPDMTCGGCARRVNNALLSVDPAADVTTNPPTPEVTVTTKVDEQVLPAALTEAGYPAERKDQSAAA